MLAIVSAGITAFFAYGVAWDNQHHESEPGLVGLLVFFALLTLVGIARESRR